MIELVFYFGTEIVLVNIRGNQVTFRYSAYGATEATIEGLKLDRRGVIKEFPDLIERADWREEAIKRFKQKIKDMDTEEQVATYIINDLKKFGYLPKSKQKAGYRRETL